MFGEVLRGEPSEIIVKTVRHVVPDLIVLGIHDEEGLAVFLSKSAVSMIASSAHLPLLLVRKSRGNALKTDSSLERPWFVVPHAFSGDRSLGP